MKIRLVAIVLVFFSSAARAEDLETLRHNLERIRAVYAERIGGIREGVELQEREILNRFIVSLVRVEQEFRDEGNLDGVVLTRGLRERLLETPVFPEAADNHPAELKRRIQELLDQREEISGGAQDDLNSLNRMYMERLEPIMRGFTRLGDFDTARRLLETRRTLAGGLGDAMPETTRRPVQLGPSGDPNVYPLSVEPPAMGTVTGIFPRRSQIPFEMETDGNSAIRERDFLLRNGSVKVPEEATEALVHQVKQNHMLTLEFGIHANRRVQGAPHLNLPAPLIVLGNDFETANLAVTQEGPNLFLYLRTNVQPEGGRPLHRVNLGRVDSGRMEHFTVTYRSGELTVYKDGTETQKLRGDVTGQLTNWEPYPLFLGWSPSRVPEPDQLFWNGRLVMCYFRAGHETSRAVGANYNRFANFVTSP